ncbi:probable arginine--tRNA ligase, mitochondrial isoform X2 [Halyomorpha halys]|uniref:probable arginine--tRNA ligase, mitochondrial isoform X2 n=1 Tax=Halyomorpha halys TaxID=286706 RepID=UPI0034D225B5
MLRYPILDCRKQICKRDLKSLNVPNMNNILSMECDSTIKHVSKNSIEGEESIIFHVDKNELYTSVLKTSLISYGSEILRYSSKKKVVVDFSSPNIAKPFHMGHLRSTIVGNFVANIVSLSNNVKRLNYLGDWGTQIGYVKIGLDSLNVPDVLLLKNPMKELYKAYSLAYNKGDSLGKAKEIFAELEKNSSSWTEEWKKIRLMTVEHLKELYSSFGISFDEYLYESDYRAQNISHVIDHMKNVGLICSTENFLAMEMDGLKIPLFKSDGTTLYLMRDIASALDRLNKYDCDTLMYVVDKSQSEHLSRLKFALSKLVETNVVYIPFGRVNGMSTRKGTSIFLVDILNEAVKIMAKQQDNSPNTRSSDPEVTRILGITCLLVYVLKHRRDRNFQFNWQNALQATGDTGSKLQYTHCRLCSLEETCGVNLPTYVNATVLTEPTVFELMYELTRFQDVINCCQNELESFYLVNYAFKLSNTVSRCLKNLPVKGQPSDIAQQRLLLFHTAKKFLHSSMKILGLQPLNKM